MPQLLHIGGGNRTSKQPQSEVVQHQSDPNQKNKNLLIQNDSLEFWLGNSPVSITPCCRVSRVLILWVHLCVQCFANVFISSLNSPSKNEYTLGLQNTGILEQMSLHELNNIRETRAFTQAILHFGQRTSFQNTVNLTMLQWTTFTLYSLCKLEQIR